DIINRQDTSAVEVKEYVEIIREETEQLTVLIKNLFQLAKIDQNNFLISREYVELCGFLENIVERMQPVLAENKLSIYLKCSDELIACIDPERFQQVLINILENAKRHSDEGAKILLEVQQTDQHIIITIIDEGEGIPTQDLPYIFERLYRVEKSRSRQSGGAGLGLAITKEIVESHGGSIEVQSKLGKGTSVIIKLARWGSK